MDNQSRQLLFDQVKKWILEAGGHIRDAIDEPLYIDTKSNPNDLVTQMDRNTEEYFAKKIRGKYPNHLILSEEGFGDEVESLDGTIWIIDPIDGTMNFVHQKRNFAISIGIYHDGIGEIAFIYNVMDDVLYSAQKGQGAFKNDKRLLSLENKVSLEESIVVLNSFWACENQVINEKKIQDLVKTVRGTRSFGSAALELAFVAEGIVDGYLTMKLAPWDIAAGAILVNEVGGITTKANGDPLNLLTNNTILSGNKQIHETISSQFVELKK
ncbi:inositol monophosphatase [Aquibacillus halophilus]|uniref:inositol-phosphate phosphatase n=1 Tax=Aquibacillus halophilus TaxID=930132 RepID=A0A6A8DG98_9BACI|nr:inositol monophosphatase family protein [Aquibacillus halophilus]MRH41897.1 inositol monophosphatase [Aquibacillus halophilus]